MSAGNQGSTLGTSFSKIGKFEGTIIEHSENKKMRISKTRLDLEYCTPAVKKMQPGRMTNNRDRIKLPSVT